MYGMLARVDGGGPGQRSRAVRAGLHGPPGGAVRLAGGGHPGAGGLLRGTIVGHGVIRSRRRNPRFPGRLDRHDRARGPRESLTLVLLASRPAWATAARRRAGATASLSLTRAPPGVRSVANQSG